MIEATKQANELENQPSESSSTDVESIAAGSAVELMVIGLLAALIILLAVPVVGDLKTENPNGEYSAALPKAEK